MPSAIWTFPLVSQNLESSQKTPIMKVELPDKKSHHCMHDKMLNDTATAVQHPPKAHHGLSTTSWLRPSSFDKHGCPYAEQWSNPTNRGQLHHDLRFTTSTDREQ